MSADDSGVVQLDRIGRILETHWLAKWMPLVLFVGIPAMLVVIAYVNTSFAPTASFLLLVIAVLFLVYIARYRRKEIGAGGSVIPTALGPLCASMALKGSDSPLVEVLIDRHGDFIVELSFFFSGIIGHFLYVAQKMAVKDRSDHDRHLGTIGLAVGVVGLFLIALNAKRFFTPPILDGPPIFLGTLRFPGFSLLLIGRALLILFGILLVTYPADRKQR